MYSRDSELIVSFTPSNKSLWLYFIGYFCGNWYALCVSAVYVPVCSYVIHCWMKWTLPPINFIFIWFLALTSSSPIPSNAALANVPDSQYIVHISRWVHLLHAGGADAWQSQVGTFERRSARAHNSRRRQEPSDHQVETCRWTSQETARAVRKSHKQVFFRFQKTWFFNVFLKWRIKKS